MIGQGKLPLVSADAHMGGTRDESQRDSAGEARYNMVMSCHISHLQQSHLYQGIVAMISHTITISTTEREPKTNTIIYGLN